MYTGMTYFIYLHVCYVYVYAREMHTVYVCTSMYILWNIRGGGGGGGGGTITKYQT